MTLPRATEEVMVPFGWFGGGLYDKVSSEALIAAQMGPALTLEHSEGRPTAGGVTVSQTIDMCTMRSSVDRVTDVKVLWCEGISESRGRLHIFTLSGFRVVDDMPDDSSKLESGNLTSDLTPDFTDCGGDPRCGE